MQRLILLLPVIVAACAPVTHEPANLSDLKAKVAEYADSDAYSKDLTNSVAPAKSFLISRAKDGIAKPAVVFDIDETVLSNLPHMKKADWGYQPNDWDAWVGEADALALAPVREIYKIAIDHGIAVIFLSGRTEADRAATSRNLRLQGMGKYQRLVLRPNKGVGKTEKAVVFKTRVRKGLTSEGYTILASFGDQQSDLEGGYAERTFKLPNPFYKIP